MFLFFNSDIFAALGIILIYVAPLIALGWIIYALAFRRSGNTSITDWKDSDKN